MTERACRGCQVPEQRGVDPNGSPTLNINPLSGLCLPCQIEAASREHLLTEPDPLPFDARAAAANDRGDDE